MLFIVGVVFLAYYRTLTYKFIIDDHDHIKPDTTPNKWLRYWEHFYGIKVTNLPLTHLFSILVHTLVCCMIYVVFGKNNISFLTSLLFAINPVNNQCSVWLSGRAYAISTALFLSGMLFLPTMPIVYALANWWSINTLFAPIFLLLVKPSWSIILMPLALLLLAEKNKVTIKAGVERYKGATNVMSEKSPRKLIICLKTLGYYTVLCLFPFKLGMCHDYLSTFGLTKKETDCWFKLDVFFFVGLGITGAVLVNLIHPFFPPLYGLLWFVLFSVQWLNFIVISHLITERYVYLANIGLMYLLANLIIGTPLMWVFLTMYAVRLYHFLPAYSDIMMYWKHNTEDFPHVAMGWNQLGLAQLQFGNQGSALDSWIRGVQERPNDFRLNFNTANLLLGCGNTLESVRFVKSAEENLDPKNGYDFWKTQVDALKNEIRKRGVEI